MMRARLLGLVAAGLLAGPAVGNAALIGELQVTSPFTTTYTFPSEFSVFAYSASGDVTAAVRSVDLQLGSASSTSGCEAADFAGFAAGNIALIQRGICSFESKAENAAAAGASAVVIFNSFGMTGPVTGTLGAAYTGGIPVVGIGYADGALWATTAALTAHVRVYDDGTTVPEPGIVALFGAGLLGTALAFRRGRRSAGRPHRR